MSAPYRTASPPTAPRAPWWRRALCAVGLHSLYLVSDRCSRCEHCPHESHERLSVAGHDDAVIRTLARYHDGKATPDETRFVSDYYRNVRCDFFTD